MAEKPSAKFKIGLVVATVWKNEVGEKTFYNVNLTRSYRDDQGEWQETNSLQHSELLNAARVLERAEEWISRKE